MQRSFKVTEKAAYLFPHGKLIGLLGRCFSGDVMFEHESFPQAVVGS